MDNRSIGLLDSGVGGLTVVKQIMKQLPQENLIFIGDQARLPYGTKSAMQVTQFTRELVQFLIRQDVKMIVIACNTATAAALPTISQEIALPIIGVIDAGSQAAAQTTRNQHIALVATPGTVKSQAYEQRLKQLNSKIKVFSIAAPEFVNLVENNQYHSQYAQEVVAQTLQPLQQTDIDTLILGCTHYPLLRPLIQESVGPRIKLIDAGAQTVNVLAKSLKQLQIQAGPNNSVQYQFYTTGNPNNFNKIANDWLQPLTIKAQHVDTEDL